MGVSDVESEKESETTGTEEASAREGSCGRPVGNTDSTKRYRRTAAEISADKIQVAQMKLEAMKESEAHKLANKKPRPRSVKTVRVIDEEPIPPVRQKQSQVKKEHVPREREEYESQGSQGRESPPPILSQRPSVGQRRGGRLALYDSWFPSPPRTNHGDAFTFRERI